MAATRLAALAARVAQLVALAIAVALGAAPVMADPPERHHRDCPSRTAASAAPAGPGRMVVLVTREGTASGEGMA